MTPAAYLAVGAVRAYQWTIRPLIGANCRFWPSCSDYAVEAVQTHGAGRGVVLAAWRILRCNPWCEGGYDPVPPCDCTTAPPFAGSKPADGPPSSAMDRHTAWWQEVGPARRQDVAIGDRDRLGHDEGVAVPPHSHDDAAHSAGTRL